MKKCFLLPILLISILFSCTKEEATEPNQVLLPEPDPTIISEYHILSSEGEVSEKYTFDDFGNISTYRKMNDDFKIHYVFDDEFKLNQIIKKDLSGNEIEVVQNIIYDNNDRVIQINDRVFTFNKEEQYYIDQSTYSLSENSEPDGFLASELRYNRYDAVENNPMFQICYYIYEQLGYPEDMDIWESCDYIPEGFKLQYENNNLESHGSTSPTFYTYNVELNPLYYNLSNMPYILSFLVDSSRNLVRKELYSIISINNRIHAINGFSGDPIEDRGAKEYTYALNDINLPVTGFVQAYLNEPSGPKLEYSKYYYQGDQIPE